MGCGCGCGESSALTVFPKSQQRQAKPHLCSGLNHLGARGRHSRDKSCYHCSPTPPPPPRAVSHFREKHAGPGGCHNGSEAGTLRLGPGKSSGFQELPFPETITTSTLHKQPEVPSSQKQELTAYCTKACPTGRGTVSPAQSPCHRRHLLSVFWMCKRHLYKLSSKRCSRHPDKRPVC